MKCIVYFSSKLAHNNKCLLYVPPEINSNHFSVQNSGCACLRTIDLWAKTSTKFYAESPGKGHQLEVKFMDGYNKKFALSEIPGKDESKLWTFSLEDPAGELPVKCPSIYDIKSITINAVSTEGWNVNSAVTILADSSGRTFTGSIDRNINAWVDHNDKKNPIFEHLELTLTSHN